MPWWIDSDQLLSVSGLRDPTTGNYINTATVRASMEDVTGAAVSGQTWPLTLDYTPASNGDYTGLLEDGRMMTEGQIYWMDLTADAGGDLIKHWRWPDVARYRGKDD